MANRFGRTHGLTGTRVFSIYGTMIQRCTNQKSTSYRNYGGRGIKVCQRWRQSPQAFVDDMGLPKPGYSIERENVDGDYEPSNCRWIPRSNQARNRRDTVRLTAFGETKCVAEWSCDERCTVSKSSLWRRVVRLGWEHQRAITQLPQPKLPDTIAVAFKLYPTAAAAARSIGMLPSNFRRSLKLLGLKRKATK